MFFTGPRACWRRESHTPKEEGLRRFLSYLICMNAVVLKVGLWTCIASTLWEAVTSAPQS